jgi:hypothetical protein
VISQGQIQLLKSRRYITRSDESPQDDSWNNRNDIELNNNKDDRSPPANDHLYYPSNMKEQKQDISTGSIVTNVYTQTMLYVLPLRKIY